LARAIGTRSSKSTKLPEVCVGYREITTGQAARNGALAWLPKGRKLGIALTGLRGGQS